MLILRFQKNLFPGQLFLEYILSFAKYTNIEDCPLWHIYTAIY